jgi:hypothetical protein
MGAWVWVLIPLAGILVGAFREWLKFKEKQHKLGDSAHELEATVAALSEKLAASERRIQNLEAIVTSQMWDAIHDDGLTAPERDRAFAEARASLDVPEEEPDAERVAKMARRLRT